MAKDWMRQFVDSVLQKQAGRPQSTQVTAAQAERMFERLCGQIEEDVSSYRSEFPAFPLQYEAKPGSLMIRHEGYPYFVLTATLTDEQAVRIVTVKKKFPDSDNGQSKTFVFLVAGKDGGEYYRVNGNDRLLTDEAEVSECLLRPLLEFLHS